MHWRGVDHPHRDAADHVLDAGGRLFLGAGRRVLAEPWRAQNAVSLAWAVGDAPPRAVPGVGVGVVAVLHRPAALALAGVAWQAAACGAHRAATGLAAAVRWAQARA